MRMGLPKAITSDQGTEFNNKLDHELMKLLSIEHRLATPYHPQVIINVNACIARVIAIWFCVLRLIQ